MFDPLFLFLMHIIGILPVSMCVTPHVYLVSVQGGQKRVSDFVELELETVVSFHVGTGNQILILYNNHWAIFLAPGVRLLNSLFF